MNTQDHLSNMSDADLIGAVKVAKADLAEAANAEPNSEWHESCFAGLLIYVQELNRRGLKAETVH